MFIVSRDMLFNYFIQKMSVKSRKFECRISAIKWIIGLFWTLPCILYLMLYERILRKIVMYIWERFFKSDTISEIIPKKELKTILITGGPLTKGNC